MSVDLEERVSITTDSSGVANRLGGRTPDVEPRLNRGVCERGELLVDKRERVVWKKLSSVAGNEFAGRGSRLGLECDPPEDGCTGVVSARSSPVGVCFPAEAGECERWLEH